MPDVNLKANTPTNAPKIISMYWSLIATAVVMLSMEKAKSVIERRATTLRNLNLFWVIFLSDSGFSNSGLIKTLEKNKYIRYNPANMRIKINLSKRLDNRIRKILNNKDIVIPMFNALALNSELSRDLVRDASATALSADNNNSNEINIGKRVKISYQLSTWSRVGIKEFIAAESINYYSQSI